jgi:chromosome segregation protein
VAELAAHIAEQRSALSAARRSLTERHVAQAARERGLQAMEADCTRMSEELARIAGALTGGRATLAECEDKLAEAERALSCDEQALTSEREELKEAREAFNEVDGRRVAAQRAIQLLGGQLDALGVEIEDLSDRQRRGEVQLARVEGEFKQLTDRIWEDYDMTYAGAEAYRQPDFKLGEADRRSAELRAAIRALGAVNVGAVDEYRQISERHEELCAQRDDLTKAQIDLMGIIEELVKKMEVQFREKFTELNDNFGRTFNRLFGGGRAELQLTDPKDVLNCGIEVIAQPPGKKLKSVIQLSGGEQTLTAIAILFAILRQRPAAFCLLDEIDAALDDRNVARFASCLQDFSRQTQFVIITHNREMMNQADVLYGVTMQDDGVSKIVSVKLDEFEG